jgi:hypothetical protein
VVPNVIGGTALDHGERRPTVSRRSGPGMLVT